MEIEPVHGIEPLLQEPQFFWRTPVHFQPCLITGVGSEIVDDVEEALLDFLATIDYALHKILFDEVEIVAAGVESEHQDLVALFLDSGLVGGRHCPEIVGDELFAHPFPDFLTSLFQFFHDFAAQLSQISFADGGRNSG